MTMLRHDDMIHGFLQMTAALDSARLAIGQIAAALRTLGGA